MMIFLKRKVFLSWLWVGLCSLSIFLIVPAGRTIQRYVYNNWGREAFLYFVLGSLAVTFALLFYFLVFKLKIKSPSNYTWLFIICGLYTYFTLKLRNVPEEAVHFLEYGLLSHFLFRALSHHVRDKSIYITATLFALLIGIFDEILQWMMPLRYWDFRDAGLNALSGGLFQLAIWKVVKPKFTSERITAKSLRIFTSVFVACLIVLGLCASNTPQRIANYTKRIPFLSFLQKEEPMSEFGYKYNDSEIGVFYSRLSPKRLKKIDKQKGEENAQILNESVNKDYEQFLREYNPITDPFMHEIRVHIFRRDTYFKKGKSAPSLSERKEFYFIAYKENLILERYFSHCIEKSVYRWNEDILQESEALIDKSKPYESPVSANLFTEFSEKTMWIFILSLISFLVFINLILPFIKKRE
jgi:hypothetical protein